MVVVYPRHGVETWRVRGYPWRVRGYPWQVFTKAGERTWSSSMMVMVRSTHAVVAVSSTSSTVSRPSSKPGYTHVRR